MADLEIIETLKCELDDIKDKVINMNEIQDAYVNILHEHGYNVPEKPAFKKYLKKLVLDNLRDVHFNLPICKNQPEELLSTKATQSAIQNSVDIKNDFEILSKAAKILRQEVLNMPTWIFDGTFDNYQPPQLLHAFCKNVIKGTRKIKTETRDSSVHVSSSILAQHFVQAIKSDKQISYNPKKENSDFKSHIETPLSVGIAMDIHTSTMSNPIVSDLECFGVGISHKKLMSIEDSIANNIIEETKNNDGVYLPPWTIQDQFVWFAIDNIDFLEATPGMNTLHGTAIALFQTKVSNTLFEERDIDRKVKDVHYDNCEVTLLSCNKPKHY